MAEYLEYLLIASRYPFESNELLSSKVLPRRMAEYELVSHW
jgi:hypothetical protein